MDYIINPLWFYWLQVVNGVRGSACVVFVISVVLLIVIGVATPMIVSLDGEVPMWCKTGLKIGIILIIPAELIVIFLPSSDTLISMMIAKYATYTNAQLTLEAIKAAVDYVVQAVQSIG